MTEDWTKLPEWGQVGASFHLDFGRGNPSNKLLHVRGVVDGCAVLRRWSPRSRGWRYSVEPPVFFQVNERHIREASK